MYHIDSIYTGHINSLDILILVSDLQQYHYNESLTVYLSYTAYSQCYFNIPAITNTRLNRAEIRYHISLEYIDISSTDQLTVLL